MTNKYSYNMRRSVSISLPEGIFKQLRVQCREMNADWSEIVQKALCEYFFRTRFSHLRRKAMLEAARRDISLSEEEIFKKVS